MTKQWPLAMGPMSMNAKTVSVSSNFILPYKHVELYVYVIKRIQSQRAHEGISPVHKSTCQHCLCKHAMVEGEPCDKNGGYIPLMILQKMQL